VAPAQPQVSEEAPAADTEQVGVLALDARRASRAWPRFFRADLIRVKTIRGRSRLGATHASGSRSVRSRCASVRASTASVFTSAAAIAFVRRGCERCCSCPSASSSSASHSQPYVASSPSSSSRIGCSARLVRDPPREQLPSLLVERRDLRPHPMQIDPDVDHGWATFRSRLENPKGIPPAEDGTQEARSVMASRD
jgi:hypothetical protein